MISYAAAFQQISVEIRYSVLTSHLESLNSYHLRSGNTHIILTCCLESKRQPTAMPMCLPQGMMLFSGETSSSLLCASASASPRPLGSASNIFSHIVWGIVGSGHWTIEPRDGRCLPPRQVPHRSQRERVKGEPLPRNLQLNVERLSSRPTSHFLSRHIGHSMFVDELIMCRQVGSTRCRPAFLTTITNNPSP